MNYFKIFLICLLTLSLDAGEVEVKSIDILVQEIKNAKPENKRVLINQLKQQLRKKNQATRLGVMNNLRKSFKDDKRLNTQKQHRTSRKNSSSSIPQDKRTRQPSHKPERNNQKKGR